MAAPLPLPLPSAAGAVRARHALRLRRGSAAFHALLPLRDAVPASTAFTRTFARLASSAFMTALFVLFQAKIFREAAHRSEGAWRRDLSCVLFLARA